MQYNPEIVEKKWQKIWEEEGAFCAEERSQKKKYYVLEMFSYPSGNIHMGHVRNYAIGDVIARYKRMQGYNIFHPMGWDAFGLPAENAAIQRNIHPYIWTLDNIANMKQQLQRLGYSYDWATELTTCLPEYYKWEQLFFVRFLKKNLIYRKKAPQNWCPECHTVLANEQVKDNLCWRCDSPIEQKELTQWFLRITDYAERLLKGLDTLSGWPNKVIEMQRHWIGRSEGVELDFTIENTTQTIRIFTTRIDTVFGVSCIILAPEHHFIKELLKSTANTELVQCVENVTKMTNLERQSETLKKEGAFTGIYVIHPLTKEKIPLWTANFVLGNYGTGAVMCVPAHDQRDFEFAQQYSIPINIVIHPTEELSLPLEKAYTQEGTLSNSMNFTGLSTAQAKKEIVKELEGKGIGKISVQYRLRDWNISRQRYWGTPIPVVYCEECGIVPENEENLPVVLPTEISVRSDGKSALAESPEFVNTVCPCCGKPARRETDTLDTFFESSWYFLRYLNPQDTKQPLDKVRIQEYMPVDYYIGGIEHAVMHLLYARFFTMALSDEDFIHELSEPFDNLLTQGMVLKDGTKMSKSKGNTVDPTEMIAKYGADTVRLFCLFAAPPERDFDWSDSGIEGSYRFLCRVLSLYEILEKNITPAQAGSSKMEDFYSKEAKELCNKEHNTIKKYTEDLERIQFNTAISSIMELVNTVYKHREVLNTPQYSPLLSSVISTILTLLAPYTPHMTEELWHTIGNTTSIHKQPVAQYNEDALQQEELTLAIQVNGKLRATCVASATASKEELQELALQHENIQKYIEGKEIQKIIVVLGKLVNIVV